ncbi:MAG: STAS domain-containing protein [Oscillospiraceae bacterium]|nr:STAS domain-containing protein [Oscillospiraceae bacterium]
MNINMTLTGEKSTFALAGRLDTTTAPSLQELLIPEFDTAKNIELDFTELVYVSSAGLRVLLMGEKAAKAKGASMTLTGVSEEIMEVFEMTGFADMLTIV